jgi:hypothetical protein
MGFLPDDEMGCESDSERRLSDLRSISEQLWGRCDGEFDIVLALPEIIHTFSFAAWTLMMQLNWEV